MKTILVTGPIGSGKSQVCRILEDKGYPVYDSDSRTKELYAHCPELKSLLEKELSVKFEDLQIIFSDSEKRKKLEEIVYPLVRKDFEKFKEDNQESDTVFFESAAAWQKPQFKGCFDSVWLVEAPFQTRLQRNPKVLQRNSLQDFNGLKADKTITNDSTLDELKRKIDTII